MFLIKQVMFLKTIMQKIPLVINTDYNSDYISMGHHKIYSPL